jgi:hypothetical protein
MAIDSLIQIFLAVLKLLTLSRQNNGLNKSGFKNVGGICGVDSV